MSINLLRATFSPTQLINLTKNQCSKNKILLFHRQFNNLCFVNNNKIINTKLINLNLLTTINRKLSSASGQVNNCTMRFVQFCRKNDTNGRIGIVSEDGTKLIDLSGQSCCPNDMINFIKAGPSIDEIDGKMSSFKSETITDEILLLPPVTNPEKIICIGLNYLGHCLEQNKEAPKEPMFFSKFASTLVGPTGNVIHHNITNVNINPKIF